MSVYSATTSSNKYITLELEISEGKPDYENNTSPVSWWLRVRKSGSSTSATWGNCSYSANINGNQYSGSSSVSVSPGGATALLSGTVTVPHNPDGSKTLSVSGSISGKIVGSVSGSQVLTTIPRASSITAPTFTLGSAGTITINRAASGFTHTLEYWYGSAKDTIVTKTGSTSVTWIPYIGLASQTPSATQGTGTLICTTYSGDTQIGQSSIAIKIQVPSSVVPSISSVAISEAVSGLASKFGAYVQGKSKLRIQTSASGAYGSTISNCMVSVADVTYSGLDVTSNIISKSGTVSVTATVTDSRGRSASKTVSVDFVAYSQPAIYSFSVHRCNSDGTDNNDGDYAYISYNFAVASVGDKNSKSAIIQYKRSTSSSWTTLVDLSSGAYAQSSAVVPSTVMSSDYRYDIRLTVADYFSSSMMTAQLRSSEVILDFLSSGKGTAFGKTAETEGALDVGWKLIANNGAAIKEVDTLPLIGQTGILSGDFNNYTTQGKFVQSLDGSVASMANRPCDYAGTLYCIFPLAPQCTDMSGTWKYLVQIYIDHYGYVYTRFASTGSTDTIFWGGWATYLHTRNLADYIVASGTSGIWTYIKYSSGIAVCYGAAQTNIAVGSEHSYVSVTFPFDFTTIYSTTTGSCSTTSISMYGNTYVSVRGLTLSGMQLCMSAVPNITKLQATVCVVGRWK